MGTLIFGPTTNSLNVFEALSSPKMVCLNQLMTVILCSCNTLMMFIFGWVTVRFCLCVSIYGRTSVVLFNIYRCTCETSCQPIVTRLYPCVPLPPCLDSWWLWGRPTGLVVSMYFEQNSIASSMTYLSTMLASGWY